MNSFLRKEIPGGSKFLILLFLALLIFPAGGVWGNGYYRQGKKAFSAHRYSEAYRFFQKALQAEPGNGNPLFYIGYMQEDQNKKDEAVESYKRAVTLRMDPDLKEKAFWKIVLYYRFQGNWTALLIYSDKFLAFRDISKVRKLRDLAEKNRDPLVLEFQKRMKEIKQKEDEGKSEEALSDYRSMAAQSPNYEPARWKIALLLMKEKDYEGALKELKILTRLNPQAWEYRYKSGICNYHLTNYEEARRDLSRTRSLNEDPGPSFDHYINLGEGLVNLELGRFGEARSALMKTLEKKRSLNLGALARTEAELGHDEKAEEYAKEALKLEKGQKDALLAEALLFRRQQKSYETRARLKLLRTSLKEEYGEGRPFPPAYRKAMALLGIESYKNGDLEEARTSFDLARLDDWKSLYPSSSRSKEQNAEKDNLLYYAALTSKDRGEPARARELFMEMEDSPEKLYQVALTSALIPEENRALYYIKQYLKKEPDRIARVRKEPAFRRLAGSDGELRTLLELPDQTESDPTRNSGKNAETGSPSAPPADSTVHNSAEKTGSTPPQQESGSATGNSEATASGE